MKSGSIVSIALGLVSSIALAQATRPEPLAQHSRMPTPTLESDTTTSASSGQLITPEIVQSRPLSGASAARIEPQTQNGVTYLCGGIGENESSYLKQTAARDYDLMMTFAEESGNYIADVAVVINDARGKVVLETTCDGPLMLVDFPAAGSYRIHAEAGGKAIDRTVLVKGEKGKPRQLSFAWPS